MPRRLALTSASAALVLVAASAAEAVDPVGAAQPTAEEQLVIYTLNRARNDPARYGQQIGVDLSGVAARPPLAVNRNLVGSARYHTLDQREYDYTGHFNTTTNQGPNQMAVLNGYDLFGNGLGYMWASNANTIESAAWGYNLIPTFPEALALLIEDKGVAGLGHRVHLLAMADYFASHREIGAGKSTQGVERWYILQTGYRNANDTFLTGVVYDDANGNGRYDSGEGVGGATVTAGALSTVTMSQGGYSLQVTNGTHEVTCSGGAFAGQAFARVTVSGQNVEVDFRSGNPGAQVAFTNVDRPAVPGPEVAVIPVLETGVAPLMVQFDGATATPGVTFSWDFGDGGTSTSEDPVHTFAAGLWPVVFSATDADGTGRTLALVAAGGPPEGGTTAPGSNALKVKSGKLKVSRTGPDSATAVLGLELPGSFPGPSGLVLTVCLAGASKTFTLDAKGVATDPDGSTARLSYRKPKSGAVPDGTKGTLTVTLKGELDASLLAAGLRDAAEKRVIPGATPFGVLLAGHAYAGARPFQVNSKAGIKSVAKPAK